MNPPPGCPFQTRCPRKRRCPGDLCETVVPPMRELAPGHQVKCHLPRRVFDAMEPVIRVAAAAPRPDAAAQRKFAAPRPALAAPVARFRSADSRYASPIRVGKFSYD